MSPRQQAKLDNNMFYCPLTPCKRCNSSKRRTSSGVCVRCTASRKVLRRQQRTNQYNTTRFNTGIPCAKGHLADRYVSSGDCVECCIVQGKKARKIHRLHINAKNRERLLKNPEKYRIPKRRWKRNNKGAVNAHTAKRWAAKKKALPKWAEVTAIKEMYINCPEGYHVDHVLPLQGNLICGLHILSNLQYLTVFENSSKNNTFTPYYEHPDGTIEFITSE
jgi:hypothetical protein